MDPSSGYVISGSEDSTIRIWNTVTGECVRTLEGHTRVSIGVNSYRISLIISITVSVLDSRL